MGKCGFLAFVHFFLKHLQYSGVYKNAIGCMLVMENWKLSDLERGWTMQQDMPFEIVNHGSEFVAVGFCFWIVALFFGLASTVLMVLVFYKIFTKAGYSGAMAFLCLVPGLGILIAPLILAFGNWPVLEQIQTSPSVNQTPPPGDYR